MKQYLFSLTALALAIVFSAYSKPKTVRTSSTDDTQLTWYLVNGSGEINPSSPINPQDPMTSAELLENYYPLCQVGTEVDCARGFDPDYTPANSTDPGAEQIKKNQ